MSLEIGMAALDHILHYNHVLGIIPCGLEWRLLNREQNWRIRLNMNFIRFNVIAGADLATHMRMPLFDVPF
jgi:hypothetical protein